jgi:hypothetical protein
MDMVGGGWGGGFDDEMMRTRWNYSNEKYYETTNRKWMAFGMAWHRGWVMIRDTSDAMQDEDPKKHWCIFHENIMGDFGRKDGVEVLLEPEPTS